MSLSMLHQYDSSVRSAISPRWLCHHSETRTTELHSLVKFLRHDFLVFRAVVADQVWGLFVKLGRASAAMMYPIVQHVAVRALSPEAKRDFVLCARAHVLQVSLSVLLQVFGNPHWLINLVCVCWDVWKLGNSDTLNKIYRCTLRNLKLNADLDTLFHLSHDLKIDTIVNERVLLGIDHLPFVGHAHMGLSESWVHLFPVEILLVDDCLDTLWQDAVSEWQILDLRALDVSPIKFFLSCGGHTAHVHNFCLLRVIENFLLFIPIVMDLLVIQSFLLCWELLHELFIHN